jgi:hypothetical protein
MLRGVKGMDGNYNRGNYNNGNYNKNDYTNSNNENENDKGRFYCKIGWFAVGALSVVILGSAITLVQGLFGISYMHNSRQYVNPSDFSSEPIQQNVNAEDVLKVSNLHWESSPYGVEYVVGILSNNSDKKFSYVEVDFNIYDKNGVQVDSVYTNTLNLEPHGKWKFKAIVMDDNAYDAKLVKIIGH